MVGRRRLARLTAGAEHSAVRLAEGAGAAHFAILGVEGCELAASTIRALLYVVIEHAAGWAALVGNTARFTAFLA